MSNKIIFGGVDSSTYGIYVSGEGVFNAPVRDAEIISIPGRNGSYLLDHGRFQNIQVRYPVFNQEADKATFIQKIDAFRNAIASLKGYQRLEDTFHSDEYRMASFIGGMEVNPILYNDHSSQFELVFDCKPQRFLKSGETEVSITSGTSINNPTLFPSKPLLAAKGYGVITMNGYEMEIENALLGNVVLINPFGGNPSKSATYPSGLVNNGDAITVARGSKVYVTMTLNSNVELIGVLVNTTPLPPYSVTQTSNTTSISLEITFNEAHFTAGTDSNVSANFTVQVQYRIGGGFEQFTNITLTPSIDYTASSRKFYINCGQGAIPSPPIATVTKECRCQQVIGDSTISALGNPTYIDCEVGEAYKMVNSTPVSLNNAVIIGGKLPELSSGSNSISFDNTITELKMTPRWWKI